MKTNYRQEAQRVLEIESNAVAQLINLLDENFDNTVEAILNSDGRTIISGMGKSGIIGQKISATLSSTGTTSYFMHPAEAIHGDLGMIEKQDVIIVISNSGETDELIQLLPFLHDNGNTIVAMTGNPQSTLAQNATFHINTSVEKEACPLELAPTSSTTATLAMGDAISVALMTSRNFQPENFARFHPGGRLGRRLLTKIKDVMHKTNLPFVEADASVPEILKIMSEGRLGSAIVGDENNVIGLITDGDLRRAMENHTNDFVTLKASDVMTTNPRSIAPLTPVQNAIDLMNERNITILLVKEENRLLGIAHLFDCEL